MKRSIYIILYIYIVCDLAWQQPNVHAQSPHVRMWPVKVVNIAVWTRYSVTLIIRAPLVTGLILAYRISEMPTLIWYLAFKRYLYSMIMIMISSIHNILVHWSISFGLDKSVRPSSSLLNCRHTPKRSPAMPSAYAYYILANCPWFCRIVLHFRLFLAPCPTCILQILHFL